MKTILKLLGGDTVKLLGKNIPPSLPYFGTPAQTSISPPNYIVCFHIFNFKLLLNSQKTNQSQLLQNQ